MEAPRPRQRGLDTVKHHGIPIETVKRSVSARGANRVFLNHLEQDDGTLCYLICDAREPDCVIVACSDAWLGVCGYSPDEVLRRNCRFLQGPLTCHTTIMEMAASISAGHVFKTSVVNYHRDGTPFQNNFVLAPLVDEDDQPLFYISMHGSDVANSLDWSLATSPDPCHRVPEMGTPESLQRECPV